MDTLSRRDPFETFILGQVEKRLQKYLARGGMTLLRRIIAEGIISKIQDPQEEIGKIRSDLDVMTPATADFVGERLGKVRVQRQALDARLADLERVDYHPNDLEAATREALAYLGRFREIAIDPDAGRGVIIFYELPAGSLMMVPGPGVQLLETLRSRATDGFDLPGEAWRVAA